MTVRNCGDGHGSISWLQYPDTAIRRPSTLPELISSCASETVWTGRPKIVVGIASVDGVTDSEGIGAADADAAVVARAVGSAGGIELGNGGLLAQPAICSVITGARKAEHVTSNVKASDWILKREELKDIEAILDG